MASSLPTEAEIRDALYDGQIIGMLASVATRSPHAPFFDGRGVERDRAAQMIRRRLPEFLAACRDEAISEVVVSQEDAHAG